MQTTSSITPLYAELFSQDDRKERAELLAQFILLALGGRGAWFASDESRSSDLSWTDHGEWIETEAVDILQAIRYEMHFCPKPELEMLRTFMLSGDVQWDSVIIVPLGFEARSEVLSLLSRLDFSDPMNPPLSPGEMITTLGDGTGVVWIHHHRPVAEMENAIKALLDAPSTAGSSTQ
jgi:hypothetical protein